MELAQKGRQKSKNRTYMRLFDRCVGAERGKFVAAPNSFPLLTLTQCYRISCLNRVTNF